MIVSPPQKKVLVQTCFLSSRTIYLPAYASFPTGCLIGTVSSSCPELNAWPSPSPVLLLFLSSKGGISVNSGIPVRNWFSPLPHCLHSIHPILIPKCLLKPPASLPVIAMIVARSPQWFINYSLWFPVCPPPIYFPQNSTENQAISFSWETLQWFPIAVFWLSRPWSSGSCLPLLPHILPLAPLRFCSTRTDFLSVPQRAQSFSHVSILVQLPSLPGMRFHPFPSGQPSPSTGRNYN